MPSNVPAAARRAFTSKNTTGLSRQLVTPAAIWLDKSKSFEAKALWDTGATNSCISKKVVEDLGLIPTGQKKISTPSGSDIVSTYLVSIVLPNHVVFSDVEVCDTKIGDQGVDLLVGMDIINCGDFAVTNCDGKTVFSFCVPSSKTIDFVKEVNREILMGPKHGTGNKKKKKK